MPALMQLRDAKLSIGTQILLEEANLQLDMGQRACLIGANGSGKSTLMRALAGNADFDSGRLSFAKNIHVFYMEQVPDLRNHACLLDYVATGLDKTEHYRAEAELTKFDLDPLLATENLSGGEIRKAALARAFAQEADLLLLDEPTNHLDIEAIEQLEARLIDYPGTVFVISHDRKFLENVADSCVWLRHQKLEYLNASFSKFDDWQAQLENEQAHELGRIKAQLKNEERWLARGITARRRRNQGRLTRLKKMRAEQRKLLGLAQQRGAALAVEMEERSGKLVVELTHISHGFGERKLISDLSLHIARGERLGIAGPNGAGKSTLLRIIQEQIQPQSGHIRHGNRLEIAYLDQNRTLLQRNMDGKKDRNLWEALAPFGGDSLNVRGQQKHVAAYAQDFLFSSAQLHQPVHKLSGGEQNRLNMAIAFAQPENLLIMDEPTNDLDLETLDLLTEMVSDYDGSLIIVSHDRDFLDQTVTRLLVFDGKGGHHLCPGGWSDYRRELKTRNAQTEKQKKKTKYPTQASKELKNPGKKKKLSYMDQRRYEEAENLMPKLEKEISAIEEQLLDPQLYACDPDGFSVLSKELESKKAQLEESELLWLELEEKRCG